MQAPTKIAASGTGPAVVDDTGFERVGSALELPCQGGGPCCGSPLGARVAIVECLLHIGPRLLSLGDKGVVAGEVSF